MVTWFLARVPKQFNGERIIFSKNGAGTTGYPYVKEVRSLHHTILKKMDQRPKCMT